MFTYITEFSSINDLSDAISIVSLSIWSGVLDCSLVSFSYLNSCFEIVYVIVEEVKSLYNQSFAECVALLFPDVLHNLHLSVFMWTYMRILTIIDICIYLLLYDNWSLSGVSWFLNSFHKKGVKIN